MLFTAFFGLGVTAGGFYLVTENHDFAGIIAILVGASMIALVRMCAIMSTTMNKFSKAVNTAAVAGSVTVPTVEPPKPKKK